MRRHRVVFSPEAEEQLAAPVSLHGGSGLARYYETILRQDDGTQAPEH
ncbi:hypothetical protein [Verminephrobacter aporrectodeae]|nr:hypothetical protein [Verminephrobacter aporrectodeae]